jgi:hypothetical protein
LHAGPNPILSIVIEVKTENRVVEKGRTT